MKKCLVFAVSIIFLASCSQEKSIRIKGKLSSAVKGTAVLLQKTGPDGLLFVCDSAKTDSEGGFTFAARIAQPVFYTLTVNGQSVTLLLQPGEKMTLTGDAEKLAVTYEVVGSSGSDDIRQLESALQRTIAVGDSLDRLLVQFADNRNYINIERQFQWNYLREIDSLRASYVRYMTGHPASLVSVYALYRKLPSDRYLFSRDEDLSVFQHVDSAVYKPFAQVPEVQMLHNNVIRMTEIDSERRVNRMLNMLAQAAPEIALSSPSGKTLRLSSLKGKYILLNFWSSGSARSRIENAHLTAMYDKYHAEGLELYQVSLDEYKSQWIRAIDEDGLKGMQTIAPQRWDSEVVRRYGVETVPTSFLIDRDGTVIANELYGDALEKKLSEVFSATK